ncbi:MAG: hypothetical protein PF693_21655 [Spirochaetia bacterium]|nr:hypothetical protein [Spirochaetia bacterium]
MAMVLKKEELQLIGEYVQEHLIEWLPEQTYPSANLTYTIDLAERIIRVEEELKNQRELMKQGFDQIDKRVDLQQKNMDKRFELMQISIDKRFDGVDKRFEGVDKRFDEVNIRLEKIDTKMFHFMIWSSGFTATVAGIVVALIKFT